MSAKSELNNGGVGNKILTSMQPLFSMIPEVQQYPQNTNPKKALDYKIYWTIGILVLYLVCSQIPLYGIQKMAGDDPLYWTRVILASNRGTIME